MEDRTNDLKKEFEELSKDPNFKGRPLVVGNTVENLLRKFLDPLKEEKVIEYVIRFLEKTPPQPPKKEVVELVDRFLSKRLAEGETPPTPEMVNYVVRYIEMQRAGELDEKGLLVYFIFTDKRFLRVSATLVKPVVEMMSYSYDQLIGFSSQKGYPQYDENTEKLDSMLPGIMSLTIGFDVGEEKAYTFTLTGEVDKDSKSEDPYFDVKQLLALEATLGEISCSKNRDL